MPTVDFDERRIDATLRAYDRCDRPGVAVGIAIDGRPVYRKAFGLASIELRLVLSTSMRLRIYSTTKHFACLAYLLLCEEGKAEIDDPLGKYLPELHPVTRNVTMRHLMGHMAGLRDAHDLHWQFGGTGSRVSSEDLLAFYRDVDDVNFEPGTAWRYSNGGFLLLSFTIERIARQSLEEVLRDHIFEPVGMYDTLLCRFDSDFVPGSATMHTNDPAGGHRKLYLGAASAGEGGMLSTVDDMLRWLAHMSAPTVGNATTWKLMTTPQLLSNGTSTKYGLGLFNGRYRGVDTIHHAGGGMGANAQMLKVPAAGLDIIIMANSHDCVAELLAHDLLDALLPDLHPKVRHARRPTTEGVFRSPTTGRVIRLFEKESRQLANIDGVDYEVEGDEEGRLRPSGMSAYLRQAVTLQGDPRKPTAVQFDDFGNADELIAVQATESPSEQIGKRYRSETMDTEVIFTKDEQGWHMRTWGRFGSARFRLEPLGEGLWQFRSTSLLPWGGILSFDDSGSVLRISTCSNSGLLFKRCA